jgi:ADP-heptose:LPS heptosyltransferase
MHKLTLTQPINLGKTLGIVAPGSYLLHDVNAFEFGQLAERGSVKLESTFPFIGNPDGPVLIMRSGAIGDLLMLTPALREFVLATNSKPALCCHRHHFPLFEGNPWVGELVPYPLNVERLGDFREIISLENVFESNHTEHPTELFYKALGLTETKKEDYAPWSRKPIYTVTAEEIERTKKYLYSNRPNIALHMRASVANRDYPPQQWLETIVKLEQRGWGVMLLGRRGQFPPIPPQLNTPYIRNLAEAELSLRDSVAVASQCTGLIGPDSSFLHFAHALDLPAIGLFGAFPWQIRIAGAKNIRALSGKGDCAGCCYHMHAGRQFPMDKPCTHLHKCVVMETIEPNRIVAAAELLKKQ